MGSVGKPMGSMREALGSVFSSCLTSVHIKAYKSVYENVGKDIKVYESI